MSLCRFLNVLLPVFFAPALFAATQYEFDPGTKSGRSGSLRILEDISTLTLYSDFGSIGNSGSVGYYVYTDSPENAVRNAATFSKSDGAITLTDLRAGENVGFFLLRKNGTEVNRFQFIPHGDSYFLAFDKNGGNGRDEVMFFRSIVSESAPVPAGQPLPGLLFTLIAGAAVLLIIGRRRAARGSV